MFNDDYLLHFFSDTALKRFEFVMADPTEHEEVPSLMYPSTTIQSLDESLVSLSLAFLIYQAEWQRVKVFAHSYVSLLSRLTGGKVSVSRDCVAARIHFWFAVMSRDIFTCFSQSLMTLPLEEFLESAFVSDVYIGTPILWWLLEIYKKFSVSSLSDPACKPLRVAYNFLKDIDKPSKMNQSAYLSLFSEKGCHYLSAVYKDSNFYMHNEFFRHDFLLYMEKRMLFPYLTKLVNGHYQLSRMAVVAAIMMRALDGIQMTQEEGDSFLMRFQHRFSYPSLSLYLFCLPRLAFRELAQISFEENKATDIWYLLSQLKQYVSEAYPKIRDMLLKAIDHSLHKMSIDYTSFHFPVMFPEESYTGSAHTDFLYREPGLASLLIILRARHALVSDVLAQYKQLMQEKEHDLMLYRLSCQCQKNIPFWQSADQMSLVIKSILDNPVVMIKIGSLYFVTYLMKPSGQCVSHVQGTESVALWDIRHGRVWCVHRSDIFRLLHMIMSTDLSESEPIQQLTALLSMNTHAKVAVTPEWEVVIRQQTVRGECEYVLKKNGRLVATYQTLPTLKKQIRTRLSLLDQPLSIGESSVTHQETPLMSMYYAIIDLDDHLEWPEWSDHESCLSATYDYESVSRENGHNPLLKERMEKRFELMGMKEKTASLYHQPRVRLYWFFHQYGLAEEHSLVAAAVREAMCLDLEDGLLTLSDYTQLCRRTQRYLGYQDEKLFWTSTIGRRWAQLLFDVRWHMCHGEGELFAAYCQQCYDVAHSTSKD